MARVRRRGTPGSLATLWEAVRGQPLQRAFTPIEAWFFENFVADALSRAVVPIINEWALGERMLDVGAGGGITARAQVRRGRTVIGIDASASQVARFNAQPRAGSSAIQATADALPFADASFDTTYSSCAFKHWTDAHLAIEEIVRVTRPGGRIIIVELDGDCSATQFKRFARTTSVPKLLQPIYVTHSQRVALRSAPTARDLATALTHAGIRDLDVARSRRGPLLVATATVSSSSLRPREDSVARSSR